MDRYYIIYVWDGSWRKVYETQDRPVMKCMVSHYQGRGFRVKVEEEV